jgi:hypothetical protein
VSQPAAIAACKTENRCTQHVTEAAIMQDRNDNAEGTCGRQNRGSQGTHSSQNTQHLIDLSLLLCSSEQQHQQQPSQYQQQFSGHHGQQVTNQISGQSVQAKNVNSNEMDDMFLAFTVVHQIMTELSGTVTEKE